jgi:hypothetical protein
MVASLNSVPPASEHLAQVDQPLEAVRWSMETTTDGGAPALTTALASKLAGGPMNSNQTRVQSTPAFSDSCASGSWPRKEVK